MIRWLNHRRLVVRFLALYGMGWVLFLLTWTVGYYGLPEGILSNTSVSSRLAGSTVASELWLEWVRIFALNAVSSLFIIGANFIVIKEKLPLGYLPVVFWFMYYGLLLGTNSFSVPMEFRMGPSWDVFSRTGVYEMAVYALIAVATRSYARYNVDHFFGSLQPLKPSAHPSETGLRPLWVLLIAYGGLALCALRETMMLFAR